MGLKRFRSRFKGFFFVMRMHYFFPSKIWHFFAHMSDLSRWIHTHKKDSYNDFYTYKFDYPKREKLYNYVIDKEKIETHIDYLEFGVSKGYSFRWWMDKIKDSDSRFYGFDTFSGLPEDWGPYKKGDMNNGNHPPQIDDNRHIFYQGLFQQTLIPFLAEYRSDRRKIIHMDADLYSATLYVLTLLTPYLKKGDIIFFDEFNVPMHEYKAFKEWTESFYIKYKVLGGVNNFYQMALVIE